MTDPATLDAEAGPIARLTISAPTDWARRRISLQVPRLLPCAGCGGGGCDACSRRGAIEAPGDTASRRIELQLPPPGDQPVAVRVPRPFGAASPIAQLMVVVEAGPPDRRAELLGAAAAAEAPRGGGLRPWVALGIAAAAVLALARWAAG